MNVLEYARDSAPLLFVMLSSVAVFALAYWVLLGRFPSLGNERRVPRQILLFFIALLCILSIIFSLPIADGLRGQILTVFGVLFSGVVAFSATTIVANLMAGLMLRFTRPFQTGDFIRVEGFFGRVAERGLFDIEVQTEQRELIALPNTFMITHPVTVVRPSGTIIHVTLSLGYDVHHSVVSPLLIEAAEKASLKDPFVQILELGNFSITYRVSGLLTEVKSMITTQSNLYRMVLDTLHDAGVEIMSPSFMNQRPINATDRVIPAQQYTPHTPQDRPTVPHETIVFDKAEEAARREAAIVRLQEEITDLESRAGAADKEEKESIDKQLEWKRKRLSSFKEAKPKEER